MCLKPDILSGVPNWLKHTLQSDIFRNLLDPEGDGGMTKQRPTMAAPGDKVSEEV